MKNLSLFLAALLCGYVFLLPATSLAYVTTEQNAFTVDGHVGVFVIKYQFGHGKYDIMMPMRTQNGGEATSTSISYNIFSEDGPASGKTTAIILSDTPLKDGMYVAPKGRMKNFALLVFYTPDSTVPTDYRLGVTHLPFSFNGTQQLQLNPSELEHYQTESASLSK